jgi:alpha-N-acetylglucosaminidase
MRYVLTILAAGCASALMAAEAQPATHSPEQVARELLLRVLPDCADRFVFQTIPDQDGLDVFEIEGGEGKIHVRGNSGVAIASGLNWYLKHYCQCQLSLCGDQLELPDPLPPVPQKVRLASPYRYRYFFNYCAFSYTMAWWDWPEWQRMIDWMALHGVNAPLSVTGQEAVWRNVYRRLGLSDAQLKDFFVGPAYLPFGWMGCIDGWGGPLPDSWIDSHLKLQKQIVARQRELGMKPVLQGFTGHVPATLGRRFPRAKFRRLPSWCGFPGTHFVDPTDPLFKTIGKAFIEEQTRQFGSDHLYASDTFIEMRPPSDDPAFLTAMGKAVYGAMQAGDPDAVWVMQGWVFVSDREFWQPPQAKALFGAVPDDRMILLDLYCEVHPVWQRTEAFYGKPWIWCILHNFGGKVGLYGGLPQIAEDLNAAMTSPNRGNLAGIGVIMEGFGYNPIVYDFLTDATWRTNVPDLDSWCGDFVHRRYGRRHQAAQQAWQLLEQTVYRQPSFTGTVICLRPGLPAISDCASRAANPDRQKLADAWDKLLQCSDQLGPLDTYQFDLVHLARQNLAALAEVLADDVYDAYLRADRPALAAAGGRFLELIRDMDELLGTRREFLLGKWLADARRWATTDQERRLYEWNARNLITLWGPPDSGLHEYAQRQWSGLLGGFYLARWQMFLKRLDESLAENQPLDSRRFEHDVRAWEDKWTHQNEPYPAVPQGDPVAVSRRMWQKYGQLCSRPAEPDAPSLSTGKPASCSAWLPGHPPQLANDGRSRNRNQHWATDVSTDKDPWWQVDLEEPTVIGRVVVVFYYDDGRHYGFSVETSVDGKTWQTVAEQNDNQQPSTRLGHTCRFTPRPVRFIRVRIPHNSANTGRHLVEVMAFKE